MSQIDKLKNASSRNCNYCKNNAVSSIAQCILCEGIYHNSCALGIAGLTAVGKNNLVKCCGPTNEVISESAGTMQLEDSLKEIVSAKDLVISSKDEIIAHLKDKESLLHQNIAFLQEKIEKCKVNDPSKSDNTAGYAKSCNTTQAQTPRSQHDGQHNSKQNPTGTTNTNVQHNTKQNSTSTANPNDNKERENSCANNSQVPKLNNNNPNLSNIHNKSNRGLASSVFRTNNRNSEAKNPNPLTTQ
ncbi:hypothetical protein JTB14_025791 [Gonioctena quinquepunctata]|nr:hypothetical protein JTB14_025791 [Gonioctena quinquepunctata]